MTVEQFDREDAGKKYDGGKVRLDLLPPEALLYLQNTPGRVVHDEGTYLFQFAVVGGPDRHHLMLAIFAMCERMKWTLAGGLAQAARVLMHGAGLYGEHNWRKGMRWSRLIGAAMRHLFAMSPHHNDAVDEESGLPHAAHFLCCVLFLLTFALTNTGTDDRYRP